MKKMRHMKRKALVALVLSVTMLLTLMPGLVFDPQGHRIGYGGGYYDRYLEQYPVPVKLGICFAFQLVDAIPAETFDQAADVVICPHTDHMREELQ